MRALIWRLVASNTEVLSIASELRRSRGLSGAISVLERRSSERPPVLGVRLSVNPLDYVVAIVVIVLGAAFFTMLSLTIAGIVLRRERLMGIGQAITMPLFFASNALYPVSLMPGWLQAISAVNPLRYEIDALRGLLVGTPSDLPIDLGRPPGCLHPGNRSFGSAAPTPRPVAGLGSDLGPGFVSSALEPMSLTPGNALDRMLRGDR